MLGWALRPIQPAPALELPVVTTQRAAGQHGGRPDGCRATLMVARDRRGRPGRGDRDGVGDRYRRAARRGRRVAADPAEAKIIFGVLELGSDGVLMAARAVGDATRLVRSASATTGSIELVELTVTATADIGSGERACVDTCAYLAKDEGMLVGSHSKGMTGSLIGARLYAIFSPDDTSVVLALVVVVATAVACGFLADRYRGRVILWATAIGGAGLVLSSLGYIWPDSLGFLRHPQAGVQEVTHSRLCG